MDQKGRSTSWQRREQYDRLGFLVREAWRTTNRVQLLFRYVNFEASYLRKLAFSDSCY